MLGIMLRAVHALSYLNNYKQAPKAVLLLLPFISKEIDSEVWHYSE